MTGGRTGTNGKRVRKLRSLQFVLGFNPPAEGFFRPISQFDVQCQNLFIQM
jgi:hypothetical protein